MDWDIERRERDGSIYFTINWSPFARADKYDIVRSVPSIGGIVELYYMDKSKKLNLFCIVRSWYGGLRSTLREHTDPEIERDPYRRGILLEWKDHIWYRWSHTESATDMDDILFFFIETYSPGSKVVTPSGRYESIFLIENDAGRLITI
ncbi:MAG: hypothetical protein NT080_10590 [Spirochaetes bacterium]|nr:hypothetical protein [Spirochaetota bacterium]